jgi:nucleotide-binding universal stress UspA family protein
MRVFSKKEQNMIKRILIPLDPSPYTTAATKTGCAIARQTGALLSGLAILDKPGISKSIGPVPAGASFYAEHLEHFKEEKAQERIHDLLEKFRQTCQEADIRHQESEFQGGPSQLIIRESMFYDLVVTGLRTHFHFETGKEEGDPVDKVVDHTTTPILAVPQSLDKTPLTEDPLKVLIAFDGSDHAARALRQYVQLMLPRSQQVVVVMSDSDRDRASYYLEGAESYLKTHGIENVEREWTPVDIREHLEKRYKDWANLVVAGAHSRHGIIDFVLGSLAKQLIAKGDSPVLLGQ